MDKQVNKDHYNFNKYMTQKRWASIWHQLDEVQHFQPKSILEIGPGSGVFKASASMFGMDVKTLDIASDLAPDHLGSADAIPLPERSMDIVCAFQVLEHMPFDMSLKALMEMRRVACKAVIISLPDVKSVWASTLKIPMFKPLKLMIPNPLFQEVDHVYDGEHYWEISKRGYSLGKTIAEMKRVMPGMSVRTYRVHENPYHRFFIFTPSAEKQQMSTPCPSSPT